MQIIEVLNLGGGVQSSRLLEESIAGDMPRLDCAIFADTGWEPKAVYDHVEYLSEKAEAAGIPVHRVEGGNLRSDALRSQVRGKKSEGNRWASMPLYTLKIWMPVASDFEVLESAIAEFEGKTQTDVVIEQLLWDEEDEEAAKQKWATKLRKILSQLKHGKPVEQRGMIKRQCTAEYKIQPIEAFIKREILGLEVRQRFPKDLTVRQWFGISYDERQRCRATTANWKTHFYPLVDRFITRIACYQWFSDRLLRLPPRSACLGCPFHSDEEWRSMKLTRPDEFEDSCEFDDAIRNCGGMRGQCFLHRACLPLRDIDFSSDLDRGQLVLFDLEKPQLLSCESGHCFM